MNQMISLVVQVWQRFKEIFKKTTTSMPDEGVMINKLPRANEPYKLSSSSRNKLEQCCGDLQLIVNELLHYMDISVIEGERGKEDQEKYYKQGTSNAKFGQSAHNCHPSMAIDIVPYPIPKLENGEWDSNSEEWDTMADIFKSIAKDKNIDITWGGDFKSIVDKPHFEITNWKSNI